MRLFAVVWGFVEVLALMIAGWAFCLQAAGAIAQPLWLVLLPFSIVGAVRSGWTCFSYGLATSAVLRYRSDLQTRPMWAPRAQRRRRGHK